jgi:hypothetical protein
MRQWLTAVLAASGVILGLGLSDARGQTFNSGSTGADGALNVTGTTTLTLPANGVFNFTTVSVPSGTTLKFTRNAANTPVTILASGSVTIAGTIDLKGTTGVYVPGTGVGLTGGTGGSGGFDGGNGANGTVSTAGGSGRGPGGGTGGTGVAGGAGGGGFAAAGANGAAASGSTGGVGGAAYSDATLLPLIGGSGGGAGGSTFGQTGCGGGGGGGAIVIASSGTITLTGSIQVTGGNGAAFSSQPGNGGGGSGGAVRLIGTTVTGSGGTINIGGGTSGGLGGNVGGAGAAGRVRVEAFNNTLSAYMTGGVAASVSSGAPTSVTLANAPTLQITSVGGVATPANPAGSFFAPDVVLPGTTSNPVTVNISAANVPTGTTLAVTVVGFMGASSSATSTALSGTLASSTATASVTIPTNEPAVISVSATFAIASLEGHGPYYADGEPVDRVRVTTHGGGRSALAFITRSGREVTVSER